MLRLAAERDGLNVADFILKSAVDAAERITKGTDEPLYDFMTRRSEGGI